ncbi:hypothetical protein ACVWYF_004152 [Hymenobacter sp. UYAg731]
MLTLDQVKAHLRLSAVDTTEDATVGLYLASAQAAFKVESKRRWPEEGEPTITAVIDPAAVPLAYRFISFVDPAVLSPDEQAMALQWVLLAIGHWYENRQSVITDVRAVAVKVPETCQKLMNLIRVPTI